MALKMLFDTIFIQDADDDLNALKWYRKACNIVKMW